MANPPVMGPGGASRRERYFFQSVTVPPTSVTAVQQQGVRPGVPTPDADNTGDALVRVGGRLRQRTSSTDPTVEIKVQDVGTAPLAAAAVNAALFGESGSWNVSDSVAATRQIALSNGPATGSRPAAGSALRYAVKRTNYQPGNDAAFVGIRSTWNAHQELTAVPPDEAGGWVLPATHTPRLVEDADGNLLVIYLTENPAGGSTDTDIVIKRYNPGADYTAEVGSNASQTGYDHWAHCAGASFQTLVANGDAIARDLEAVWWNEQLFLLVICKDNGGGAPFLYVLRLVGQTLALYSGPTLVTLTSDASGITADLCGQQILIAVDLDTIHLRFLLTSDLRTFDNVSASASFAEMPEVKAIYPISAQYRDRITAIHFYDGINGFACSTSGRVYRSADAGVSWTALFPPTDARENKALQPFALYDIVATDQSTRIVVLAVGERGIMLRSLDGGDTWKILVGVRHRPNLARFFNDEDLTTVSTDLPDRDLFCVAAVSTATFIIAGEGALIHRSTDSGDVWTTMQSIGSAGRYLDLIATATDMLVVGTSDVHDDSTLAAADRAARAVFIQYSGNTISSKTYLCPPLGDDQAALVGAALADGTTVGGDGVIYALSATGQVYQFSGNAGPGVSFTAIEQLTPQTDGYQGIACEAGNPSAVWVTGPSGSNQRSALLWRSTDADTDATFVAQPYRDVPGGLWVMDDSANSGVVGGARAMWRVLRSAVRRGYPALRQLDNGAVVFACANLTQGVSEIYLGSPAESGVLPDWQLVDSGAFTWSAGDPPNDNTRRPWLTQTPDGAVVCTWGAGVRVGLNGGRSWVTGTDNLLPVPIGNVAAAGGYTLTKDSITGCRSVLAALGGLLVTAYRAADGSTVAVHFCWDWHADGTHYRPIVPIVPLSAGIDAVTVAFHGTPHLGDQWTVAPTFDYAAAHVVLDSPTLAEFRSRTVGTVTLTWDRHDAAVTALLGAGHNWNVSAIALFNTSFKAVTCRVSDPLDDTSFTEVALDQALLTLTGMSPLCGIAGTSNVLWKSGAGMTPHQYKPRGSREYFVEVQEVLNDPYPHSRWRILDNTEHALVLDGAAFAYGGVYSATIFGNRFLATFDAGDGTGPGSGDGLRDSAYRFGRYVQIVIPSQSNGNVFTYHRIGTALLCAEVEWATLLGQDVRKGFDLNFTWRPVANTTETQAAGGQKTVRHHGQTGQLWELVYLEDVDPRDRRVNALFDRMRQAFALLFTNDLTGDSAESLELVRLVDAAEFQHVVRDVHQSRWLLEEVL